MNGASTLARLVGSVPLVLVLVLVLVSPALAEADGEPSVLPSGPGFELPFPGEWGALQIGAELGFSFRHSSDERVPLASPFPEDFLPSGEDAVSLATPDPGGSIELSLVRLVLGVELSESVEARTAVHFVDLYSQNPSESDEILVREAWLRLGREDRILDPIDEGASFFLLAGRAPRFSKQDRRRMESYGLWGTAVSRFEQDQVQAGGTLGGLLYWRAMVSSGNPLFFRDPNALAGDNGTSSRVPGNVDPTFGSGFPILYDAFPAAVDLDGELELGLGLGARLLDAEGRDGIDVLGWYFQRRLSDGVPIDDSFYEGDLSILADPLGGRLPTSGRTKWEAGLNVEGRLENARLFAQYVVQAIADLDRQGGEIELAYRLRFPALFALGDLPAMNWVQPAIRFSWIENDFEPVGAFVAPSTTWDWRKLDVGVRAGIVRGIDLAIEYSRNDVDTAGGTLHPDELLVTLGAVF